MEEDDSNCEKSQQLKCHLETLRSTGTKLSILFENKDFYNQVMDQIGSSVYKELRNTAV